MTAPRLADVAVAPPSPPRRGRRGRLDRVPWWVYALLVLAAAACIFPLYWMFVVTSAGQGAATRLPPVLVPGDDAARMLELVLTTVPFIRSLINSTVVALSIAVGHAFLCSLAGFAFAKLRFRGRNALFVVVVLTMAVPLQLAVIPQYMIISALGWVDTLQALIVPGLASAFGIFWMRQHISSTVSDELLQAARLDGAGSWQIYLHVILPIVRPAAFVLGLLGFVTAWNDFLWPFIVLKSPDMFTVQIAIKALQNSYQVDLGLAMAGSFFATLPLLLVFVFVGRRMVAGIMDGAFKG